MSNRIVARRIMEKVAKRTYGDTIGDTSVKWYKTPLFINQAHDVGRLAGAAEAAGVKAPSTVSRPAVSPLLHMGLGALGGSVLGAAGGALSDKPAASFGLGVAGGSAGALAGLVAFYIRRAKDSARLKEELSGMEISDRDKERAEEVSRARTHLLNPLVPGGWSRGRGEALTHIRHGKDPIEGRGYLADAVNYGTLGHVLPLMSVYDRVKANDALSNASPLLHRLSRSLSEGVSDVRSGWDSGKR